MHQSIHNVYVCTSCSPSSVICPANTNGTGLVVITSQDVSGVKMYHITLRSFGGCEVSSRRHPAQSVRLCKTLRGLSLAWCVVCEPALVTLFRFCSDFSVSFGGKKGGKGSSKVGFLKFQVRSFWPCGPLSRPQSQARAFLVRSTSIACFVICARPKKSSWSFVLSCSKASSLLFPCIAINLRR